MSAGGGRRTFAAMLLVALLAAAQGCSREQAAPPADEIVELVRLSEIPSQLAAVHEFLGAQLELQRAHWTEKQFEVAVRVVAEQFAEAEITRSILVRLSAQQDPRYTAAAIDWLRTPEAGRIHAASDLAADPESGNDFRDFMLANKEAPPSKSRLALVERYDHAVRRSSNSRRSLLLASYGISLMADAVAADDARAGADAVRESVERRNELLAPIFEELWAIRLSFAFRNLSDADVAALVERSESETLQWYYQALSSAFTETLEEVSNGLGRAYVAALAAPPDA